MKGSWGIRGNVGQGPGAGDRAKGNKEVGMSTRARWNIRGWWGGRWWMVTCYVREIVIILHVISIILIVIKNMC